MRSIPLATRYYKNKSLPVSAQNLVSLYAEILDTDAKNRVILHQMPAPASFSSIGNDKIRGQHVMDNILYVVSGATLYSVNSSGAATSLGSIVGSDNVGMADNGTQLSIVNGTSTGYIYTISSGLASQTLTGPASTVDYLDGYFIYDYKDSGNWFISDVLDGTTLDATETGATNSRPDNALRPIVSQGKVFIFGTETIEPFYNSGALDFPFTKIKEGVIRKGAKTKWAITVLDEIIFFLGNDLEVYQLNGFQATRISDPSLSYAISQFSDVSDAEMFSFNYQGHSFIALTFPTAQKTFAYDATTNIWLEWARLSNGSFIHQKIHNYVYCYGKHLAGDLTTGNVYELGDNYTDNTDPIRWEFTTPFVHNDRERIFFGQVRVDMETGEAPATGQGSAPRLFLSHSSNGKNFSSERWKSFGPTGEYDEQIIFNRGGSDIQRCYRGAWSDPVKASVMGVFIDAV